jgi:hypothetical protein
MLIKFYSDVGGFTMFGDAAIKLLRMMGHTGTVPGAMLAEDIPAAIEKLESALAGTSGPAPGESTDNEAEGGDIPVSLRQRAFPLLELLRNAAKQECSVLWDKV